jgi:hypothetical protein
VTYKVKEIGIFNDLYRKATSKAGACAWPIYENPEHTSIQFTTDGPDGLGAILARKSTRLYGDFLAKISDLLFLSIEIDMGTPVYHLYALKGEKVVAHRGEYLRLALDTYQMYLTKEEVVQEIRKKTGCVMGADPFFCLEQFRLEAST